MNFKSDYEKIKYMYKILKVNYKEKIKEVAELKNIIENLNYDIDILNSKISRANKKNEQLTLLLDESIKEMRFLKDGETKDNK